MTARQIAKKFLSVEQAEGVGARVRRSVGRPEVRYRLPWQHMSLIEKIFLILISCVHLILFCCWTSLKSVNQLAFLIILIGGLKL